MCNGYYAASDRHILPQRIGYADTGGALGRSTSADFLHYSSKNGWGLGELALSFRLTKHIYEA